jgi:putative transcription elongation factor greA
LVDNLTTYPVTDIYILVFATAKIDPLQKDVEMTSYYCTQETYDALLEQETQLKKSLKEALGQLGEAAASDSNTWHDNAAFDATNELIRRIQSQLRIVTRRIQSTIIVEETSESAIGLGHVITLKFPSKEPFRVKMVGQRVGRSDDEIQQVSTESPLGRALLGHTTGDTVSYPAPRGEMTVEIISVD